MDQGKLIGRDIFIARACPQLVENLQGFVGLAILAQSIPQTRQRERMSTGKFSRFRDLHEGAGFVSFLPTSKTQKEMSGPERRFKCHHVLQNFGGLSITSREI